MLRLPGFFAIREVRVFGCFRPPDYDLSFDGVGLGFRGFPQLLETWAICRGWLRSRLLGKSFSDVCLGFRFRVEALRI